MNTGICKNKQTSKKKKNSRISRSFDEWTTAFEKYSTTGKWVKCKNVGKKEIWKKEYLAKCCCIWWRSQSSAASETCASFSVIYYIYNSVTAHKRVGIINAFNNEELMLIPVIRSLLSLNCQANQWVCAVKSVYILYKHIHFLNGVLVSN